MRLFLKDLIGVCHRLDNVCARLPRVDVNKVIIINDQLSTLCTGIVKGGVRLLLVLPVHLLVNWRALRTWLLNLRFHGALLVPGEPALVVLGRVDHPDELSHLWDHLVVKGRARVDCGLGLLEECCDQFLRGPGVRCELQDGVQVLTRGVHDIEQGSVDDPPQEDPGKLISQVGRGFEQLRQMLLKVELSVLVKEAPSVGTVLPENWPGRVILRQRGVFQAVEALLQVVHCILGVHCRDDNICYQMLLQALVVEEVANLEKIQDILSINLSISTLTMARYLSGIDVSDEEFEGFRVDPFGHNQPLPVRSLDIVLILVHVLIFLKSLLEVVR